MWHVRAGVVAVIGVFLLAAPQGGSRSLVTRLCSPRGMVFATSALPAGVLQAVAAAGGEVWAVGFRDRGHFRSSPLIARRTGDSFVPVKLPANAYRDAEDLWAVAATENEVWAVGQTVSGRRSLVLDWNGSQWRRVSAPAGFLDGVSASGANDVWAVGTDPNGHPLVIRWDGARWRRISFALQGGTAGGVLFVKLMGVFVRGTDDVWVVGGPPPFAAHWDGAGWLSYTAPNGTSERLRSVVARASDDVWAVGDGLTLEWSGGYWILSQKRYGLAGVEVQSIIDRRGELWAIRGLDQIVRWNAPWTLLAQAPNGIGLNALAADPTGDVWAVGLYPGGHARPAILRYRC